MSTQLKKLVLTLALVCLALVSCEGPDNCDLQMVAGGSQICEEQRSK